MVCKTSLLTYSSVVVFLDKGVLLLIQPGCATLGRCAGFQYETSCCVSAYYSTWNLALPLQISRTSDRMIVVFVVLLLHLYISSLEQCDVTVTVMD